MLFRGASEGQRRRTVAAARATGKRCGAGRAGRELELGDELKLGPGELKSGGFRRDSILADAFEAMLAAVYLMPGFDACRDTVHGLFAARIAALRRSSKDAKTRLQEWLQAGGWPLPQYELSRQPRRGPRQDFRRALRASANRWRSASQASAGSRRAAEQEAAEVVLARLQAARQPTA